MTVDKMYLDNLEEYIYDENRIVTYKWLSRTLSVPANQAKQMLYSFVQNQRNAKDVDQLHVIYLLAGLSESIDGSHPLEVRLVAEENLDGAKHRLQSVTSCHMYSVQKTQLKTSNELYLADFDLTKEHILQSNKYSAITCETAKLRTCDEMKIKPPGGSEGVQQSNNSSVTAVSKPAPKAETNKGIVGMFGKSNQKSVSEKSVAEETAKDKEETKVTKDAAAEKGKQKGKQPANKTSKPAAIQSFFAQQTNKPKKTVVSKEEEEEKPQEKELASEQKAESTKEKVMGSNEKPTATESVKKGKTKRIESGSDGGQKKRRRIRQVSESSDSSGEESNEDIEMSEDHDIPDSPPPPPPSSPPAPVPAVESSSDGEVTSGIVADTPQRAQTEGKQRRRRRRRKLVSKTTVTEDGYMETEKVWESESTDASDEETKPKETKGDGDKKKSTPEKPKLTTPPKAGRKQMSMISFFQKKQ